LNIGEGFALVCSHVVEAAHRGSAPAEMCGGMSPVNPAAMPVKLCLRYLNVLAPLNVLSP